MGAIRLDERDVDRLPGASAIELEDVLLDRSAKLTEVAVLAVEDGAPVPVVTTRADAPLAPGRWAAATADLPPLAEPVHLP